MFPVWLCETHIREIDDLMTSGEIAAANEYMDDLRLNELTCMDCEQLKAAQ